MRIYTCGKSADMLPNRFDTPRGSADAARIRICTARKSIDTLRGLSDTGPELGLQICSSRLAHPTRHTSDPVLRIVAACAGYG